MAGRVISIALVATDKMSRAFRDAGDSADRLAGNLDQISRRGADLGDAVSGLVRASAAIAAIPATGPIVAGIGAMAPAFAAAGAGAAALAAVAIPSINRIKAAMEAQASADKNAGQVAAQSQAQAAARANAQAALASAIRNAAYSHAQALEQVRQAEMSLADAQKDAKTAQLDLNEARNQAKRDAEDLKNRVVDAQLGVRQATLDVSEAQSEYNKAMSDPKVDVAGKKRAELALDQAKQNLKEQKLSLKRLQEEEKKAAKAGVEGSDVVTAARERLAEANKKVAESERSLAKARENVVRVDRQSADSVSSARRALTQANQSAVSSTSALDTAMAALSPSARTLMGQWKGLTKTFDVWQRSMEPKVLPLLGRGIALVKGEIPSLTPLVNGASKAVGGLLTRIEQGAKSKQFGAFKKELTALVPTSLSGFGNASINVAKGLMGIVQAFMPYAPAMVKAVESLTAKFAAWGTNLSGSSGFKAFMDWAKGFAEVLTSNGPAMSSVLGQVAAALIHVGQSLTPVAGNIGLGAISSIGLLAKVVSGLSPQQIQAIAYAFLAYRTAVVAATVASTGFSAAKLVADGAKDVASGISKAATAATDFAAGWRNTDLAFRDGATRATTLGAAIKSQLLLWKQQTAAALASARATAANAVASVRARVATVASAVAQKAAAAATKAWAAAQWLLNAAMRGNPVVLVVTALIALGVVLVIAYKKSETFRQIVQATWAAIKTGALIVWGYLKQFFAWLGTFITSTLVPVFKTIWTVVKLVWAGIVAAVRAAWPVLQAIFTVIWTVIKTVLIVAWTVLKNAVKVVWIAIQIYIKVAWAVIKVIFSAISWVVENVLAPVFRWLYDKVIKPVWSAIRDHIRFIWGSIKVVFNAVKSHLAGPLSEAFKKFKTGNKILWDGIKSAISTVWERGIKPIFNGIKTAVGKVKDAFRSAIDGIKSIWDKLGGIARKPVNFVIGLYNKGIVNLVNKIAAFAGIKTRLTPIPTLPGYAQGGVLPGYAPGRDTLMAAVSPGESIFRPEFTRAVGSSWVSQANAVAKRSGPSGVRQWLTGRQLGGEGLAFSRGGIVPRYAGAFSLGGIVGDFMKGLEDFSFGDIDKAANKVLTKLLGGALPGEGVFRDVLGGIPMKIKDSILGWIKSKVGSGVGGPGMQSALSWARTQVGKPWVWSAVGPSAYDCSGFMSAITNVIHGKSPYSRLFSTFSFTGQQGPAGFVRNYPSGFRIGITNSGKGHMAGTLLGQNVESASSKGVVVGPRARGYNDGLFGSWYGLKADTGHLALAPGWNPPTYNGTGRTELLSVDAAGGPLEVHLHNHGVIGSQAELDRWLASSMERLRRRKKLPSA